MGKHLKSNRMPGINDSNPIRLATFLGPPANLKRTPFVLNMQHSWNKEFCDFLIFFSPNSIPFAEYWTPRVLILHILIHPEYSSSWPWNHGYEGTQSELGPNLELNQVWIQIWMRSQFRPQSDLNSDPNESRVLIFHILIYHGFRGISGREVQGFYCSVC